MQLKGFLCEYKNVFCGALSAVVLKEMKAAFDNLWTAMVVVKPPWTLSDTIGIIEKYVNAAPCVECEHG